MMMMMMSSIILLVQLFVILCIFVSNHGIVVVVHAFTPTTITSTTTTTTNRRPSQTTLSSISSLSFAFYNQRCMFHPNHHHLHHQLHQLYSSSSSTNDDVSDSTSSTTSNNSNNNNNMNHDKRGIIIVAGATGYIGKAVVRECLRQNYITFALVRSSSKSKDIKEFIYDNNQAIVLQCDVTNQQEVQDQVQSIRDTYCNNNNNNNNSKFSSITAMVSCLASRSGIKSDSYNIDYMATLHCLNAAKHNRNVQHFILLSAFCVQKPILQFQQAKLKFEAELQKEGDVHNSIRYTIIRPTAFFKSVSGQLEVVQSGSPFVLFDKGVDSNITCCNPIAESDLATYMIDSINTPERYNQIINLGGPDEPISMLQQGYMLFNATNKEPKFLYVPIWIFDAIINTIQFFADITKNEKLYDMAETGRIGKYYAVEDMVTTLPNEKYGTITLQEHYNRIAIEGNDYDPYTTMFARARGIDVTSIQNEMKQQQQQQQQLLQQEQEQNETVVTTVVTK